MPQIKGTNIFRMKIRVLMLWCLMYSGIHKLNAQTWDIGVHTGGLCYLGDLNPNNPLYFNSGGVGIQLRKNLNSYWSLSGNFLFGVLQFYDSSSSNAVVKERNLGFYTPFYEYSGQEIQKPGKKD